MFRWHQPFKVSIVVSNFVDRKMPITILIKPTARLQQILINKTGGGFHMSVDTALL